MKGRIKRWYEYSSQAWYATSFLVRRPDQIAQAIGHDREWNNLPDSGCNFTCLAMIIGIDPARLASLLSSQSYFLADSALPAIDLQGKRVGLVWDQNAPHEFRSSFVLKDLWHPRLQRRTTIKVTFIRGEASAEYAEGRRHISAMRRCGDHVICGPHEHSYLVAGINGDGYFLWDPDDADVSVERNLNGELTLKSLYQMFPGEAIDFWQYHLDVK